MALLIRISFFLVLFSLIVSDRVGPWAAADASSVRNLGNYERIPLTSVSGPESLAFDAGGAGPYTGVSDGRVLRWEECSRRWVEYAVPTRDRNRTQCDGSAVPAVEDVCGRPLGIQFHRRTGKLYVADAYFGLLVVEPGGGAAARLSAGVEGQTFKLTNGVDVDQETGVVYFTDSSTRFQRREWMLSIATRDATGRWFMRYDPATKKTAVLLRGLQFPNGVAVSSGGDFVLVAETTKQRVLRFWVKGSKAGSSEVFAQLPWSPDNVKTNGEGEFWVAVTSTERNVVGMKLDGQGRTTQVLRRRSPSGTVSEVQEINGTLWLGSVESSFVAVYSRSSSYPFPSSPRSPSSSSLSPTSLRRSL
ncbi:unnamed protein product [Spirodela intermedia]|uniref:Strictosidine synthase conserved region domain-containing protein n=1 Tax=Spirodela intermedia TaxID=51605 RepID=A0A7I8LKE9_SPIIN|nr:unnamed protein product [Spirodela intermedia]